MNESCKRPRNSLFTDNNKKYKFSLENVKPTKGYLIETPLTCRKVISRSNKEQWIETMKSELQNFYDSKTMTLC